MSNRQPSPAEQVFQQRTKLKLGRKIYSGEGDVYHLRDYPDRLVKIVWLYSDMSLEDDLKILRYLQRSKNPAVVKIHRIGSFISDAPFFPGQKEEQSYYYYYVMDRLSLLPRKGRYQQVQAIEAAIADGAELGKKYPRKVRTFVTRARKLKYQHRDIHEWNILQTKRGSLKFIDLESFMA